MGKRKHSYATDRMFEGRQYGVFSRHKRKRIAKKVVKGIRMGGNLARLVYNKTEGVWIAYMGPLRKGRRK